MKYIHSDDVKRTPIHVHVLLLTLSEFTKADLSLSNFN